VDDVFERGYRLQWRRHGALLAIVRVKQVETSATPQPLVTVWRARRLYKQRRPRQTRPLVDYYSAEQLNCSINLLLFYDNRGW
jgi:hypothetical protein